MLFQLLLLNGGIWYTLVRRSFDYNSIFYVLQSVVDCNKASLHEMSFIIVFILIHAIINEKRRAGTRLHCRTVKKTVTINSVLTIYWPVKVLDGYFLSLWSIISKTSVAKAIISWIASNVDTRYSLLGIKLWTIGITPLLRD